MKDDKKRQINIKHNIGIKHGKAQILERICAFLFILLTTILLEEYS